MSVSPAAGQPAPAGLPIDPDRVRREYYDRAPDVDDTDQLVTFGAGRHRGSPRRGTFTQAHVLALTQAVCDYRRTRGVDGPVYVGRDTRCLSEPAQRTALEVLAGNGVPVILPGDDGPTPTPAVSRAILTHNRGGTHHLADGIVLTPSHSPPGDGGFQYTSPDGGPADAAATRWVEERANDLLLRDNAGVKRVPFDAATTRREDLVGSYVGNLWRVIDLDAIRGAGLPLGVDPLGGAGLCYWEAINRAYDVGIEILNPAADATLTAAAPDRDGQLPVDGASPDALAGMLGRKDRYRVAFATDPDAGRHGIVTPSAGLMNPNHYLAVAVHYLLTHRPGWPAGAAVGKSVVATGLIDRVAARLGRQVQEVPVGFEWFTGGLFDGSVCFAGDGGAGATFLCRDGTVWTTDRDGIVMALLAAEITAITGKDPAEHDRALTAELGTPAFARVEAPATPAQKARLRKLAPEDVPAAMLAGEPITAKLTRAPGNGAPLGGLKVTTANGWFVVRPSGTGDAYRLYAESSRGQAHLDVIVAEARGIVAGVLGEAAGC